MRHIKLSEEQWAALLGREDCPSSPATEASDVQDVLSFARETLDELGFGCPELWDVEVEDASWLSSASVMIMVDTGATAFNLASLHVDVDNFQGGPGDGGPFRNALEEIIDIANVVYASWREETGK